MSDTKPMNTDMEDKRSKHDEIAGRMSSGENDVWRFYPCDTFREAEDMQRRFAGNGERCEIGENGRAGS